VNTLVYLQGGEDYLGTRDLTKTDLKYLKEDQKDNGSVGYMYGYRYWDNQKENVIVFFDTKPADIVVEQDRRRKNGFLAATWHNL
jgi:hypothetical protein